MSSMVVVIEIATRTKDTADLIIDAKALLEFLEGDHVIVAVRTRNLTARDLALMTHDEQEYLQEA